jgi:hypothetical protein
MLKLTNRSPQTPTSAPESAEGSPLFAIHSRPVRIIDDVVPVIVLSLSLCRTARDDADRIDIEFAAELSRFRLDCLDVPFSAHQMNRVAPW